MVETSILPLRLEGAQVIRRGKSLIGPIDLEIGQQGFTAIMGPNGAGKTSLLRMMHGLERISRGTLRWSVGQAVARARQSYVFQTPIMMRRTVLDCVAYPLTIHGTPRTKARAQAAQMLERVGLHADAEKQAPVLSGGERQKLALARALIRDPDILFLDEPCTNLDGRATREIEAILKQARAAGTRIVMVTHDQGQARRLADEVLFIHHGKLHERGHTACFLNQPTTPEAQAYINGEILE